MAEPLQIAFVSMHSSPVGTPGSGDVGGMNIVELGQSAALAGAGHQVELITRRTDPTTPELLEVGPGVTLRQVDAGPPTPLPKSQIDAHIDEFRAHFAEAVRAEAGHSPYDIIHSHHWMSGVAALPLAREWGIPHVQSFHSVAALPDSPLHEGEPPESPARVPGEAMVAQQSDLIVAISAHEARTVVERCGADPDRVMIVAPGVDTELFRPPLEGEEPWRWPGADDDPSAAERGYVVFAARLQPLKGPDLAIETLTMVHPMIRPHLVIAGEAAADFAGYREELDRLIDSRGLRNNVTFLGPQERPALAQLLRHANVLLVPSHSETFGLIALEAAASGTPVLAAAAGGLREAVVDGETGLLQWTREPVQWGAALTRLLRPDVRQRAGQTGRMHARRFSWTDTAAKLERLYTDLIGVSS